MHRKPFGGIVSVPQTPSRNMGHTSKGRGKGGERREERGYATTRLSGNATGIRRMSPPSVNGCIENLIYQGVIELHIIQGDIARGM